MSLRTTDEIEGVLKCNTDKEGCCKHTVGGEGEWQFPNSSNVAIQSYNNSLYRNRGTNIVRLRWRNDSLIPSGIYCCIIPAVTQMACIGVYPENDGKQ